MNVFIKEVLDVKGLKKFVQFPFSLYKNNPYWAPTLILDDLNTLRWDKNPAFEYCEARYWLAYDDNNQIVGRIAAIFNRRHIEKWGQKYLRFGWIDFIDDPAVSSALLQTVEDWAREKGLEGVHGPLGFTDLDPEGMLVEGFTEIGTLATIYNYPYYPEHLQKLGYQKDIDWMEYEIMVPDEPDERISRAAKIIMKRNNLTMLEVKNKKELLNYAHELFELLEGEYSQLYGVVPLTEKQVASYIDQYFGFVHHDFVPVVLDSEGHMVAFGVVLPSLTYALQKARGGLFPFGFLHLLRALRKNDRVDLYLIAVKKEYQGKGVNAILMDRMIEVFKQRGVVKAESNPELENNHLVQAQWKYFERRQHKRRRCFIKLLG